MLNLRTMYRLRRLINVMLPVLATQLAIIGMNFFAGEALDGFYHFEHGVAGAGAEVEL